MFTAIIVIFFLVALLGIYLLSFVLTKKQTPKAIAFTHGPLAVIGLVLLLIYSLMHQGSQTISILIILLAAVSGLTLIYRDITGRSLPKILAIAHGVTALIAVTFIILIHLAIL